MNEPVRLALKLVMWLVGIIAFLLLFVVPVGTMLVMNNNDNPPDVLLDQLRNIETLQTYSIRFLTSLWFFVLGSCFASFLNVVAWRIPRGRSILGSSHCPKCDSRLAFTDNFPVVGWLRNGGRCRTCKLPISPRYLIVEVVLGGVVLLIVLSSLISGGVTFPIRTPNAAAGFERILFDTQFDLLQIVGGHLVLLLFLFTFALVELENSRIPKSIFAFGLIFGVAMPLVMPAMQLVVWNWPWAETEWPVERFSIAQFATIMVGSLVGCLAGWFVSKCVGVKSRSQHGMKSDLGEGGSEIERDEANEKILGEYTSYVFGFVLVGMFLGWQSVSIIAAVVLMLSTVLKPVANRTFVSAHSILFFVTIVHLLTWRWLNLIG